MRIPQSTFLSMDGAATARSRSSQSSSDSYVSSRSVSSVSVASAVRREPVPDDSFNTTALWIWMFGMVLGVLGFIAIQFETLCTDVPANEDTNQTISFALERHKMGSTPALIKGNLPALSSPT